jgi:hypothetical protein
MKTLGLVLAMMFLLGGCCFAQTTTTVTIAIATGTWNLIALPCVPIDPAVGSSTGDTTGVFGQFNTTGAFTLEEENLALGGYTTYKPSKPAAFGNMLLGSGYWVTGSNLTGNVTYACLNDGVPDLNTAGTGPATDSTGAIECTDMYISLPGAGTTHGAWQMIGHPFNHTTAINAAGDNNTGSRIMFTDGTQMLTWSAAATAGWVGPNLSRANTSLGGYTLVGFGQLKNNKLTAGSGYWIQMFVDNIAMIIPGKEDGLP